MPPAECTIHLRPPVLKEAVDWIARQVVRQFEEVHEGIAVSLRLDVDEEQQEAETTKTAFYYILTEALNNVSKHAQATQVRITLHDDEDGLRLTVWDDGVGPSAATYSLAELLRLQHQGVADMHRWAAVGGGVLRIEENEVGGTAVSLFLPTGGGVGATVSFPH